MSSVRNPNKEYYFIDIELESRRIIGWGTETRKQVEVRLTEGFHRLFLSKGQYNKLVGQLKKTDSSDSIE